MIFSLIINFFAICAGKIISLLPDGGGLPPQFQSSFLYLANKVVSWNAILPIDTLFTLIGFWLVMVVIRYPIWGGVKWLLGIIRGTKA